MGTEQMALVFTHHFRQYCCKVVSGVTISIHVYCVDSVTCQHWFVLAADLLMWGMFCVLCAAAFWDNVSAVNSVACVPVCGSVDSERLTMTLVGNDSSSCAALHDSGALP